MSELLVTKCHWVVEGLGAAECQELSSLLRNLRGLRVSRVQLDPAVPGQAHVEMEILGSDEPAGAPQLVRELGGRVLTKRQEHLPQSAPTPSVFPEERPLGTKNL